MAGAFRLTGRHVLAALVGFFLMVIVANTIFITLAVRSYPGEEEEKSYLQGLHFNDRLAAREAQSATGWTVQIAKAERKGDQGLIELVFTGADAAPISALDVTGSLSRAVDDDFDQAVMFSPVGAGRYQGEAANLTPGVWVLRATATSPRDELFELETKLYLE